MPLALPFCKMHGLGNDFVVLESIRQAVDIKKIAIPRLADRHLGIGFDQLLLVEKSTHADFACRIFNADGSEAKQCGNGMRCVARFVLEEHLTQQASLTIATPSGLVKVFIQDFDHIQVNMGPPCFLPAQIPFLVNKAAALYDEIRLDAPAGPLFFAILSMGNPHAILRVSAIKNFPVTEIGAKIATHPAFPQGANVGFMEIMHPQHIRLRTFERGVGETLACGSNACAAVVAGIINGWLEHKVTVELEYGNLFIEWEGKEAAVVMSGPAARVFSGILCP
jgi:diaminopimelate epimerase